MRKSPYLLPLAALFSTFLPSFAAFSQNSAIPDEQKRFATGTGFFISDEGYVITAQHVISNCRGDISVHGRDVIMKAKLIAGDEKHDLAVVKIIPKVKIANIAFFPSGPSAIKVGDPVVVAGFPHSMLGDSLFPDFLTNNGKIISVDSFTDKNGEKPLLFSNITEQGYSGGPVLDALGNIIGVTLAGTCIGEQCREAFKQAMSAPIGTMEDKRLRSVAVARHVDANVAANLDMIYTFLNRHQIPYVKAPKDSTATETKIAQVAQAVVNVRCIALEKELLGQ